MNLVSVIIPNYNRGSMLFEAVQSCLAQDGVNVEVIVVDDGSTDDSASQLQTRFPEVVVLRQTHRGGCAARNLGLLKATGDFIKFLDSDDILASNVLASQIAQWRATGADVVYGDFEMFGNLRDARVGGLAHRRTGEVDDPVDSLLGDWWCAPFCYLYTRESIGNQTWDVGLDCLQDFDFILRFAMRGKRFSYKPGVVGFYRIHGGQITNYSAVRYAVNRCVILENAIQKLLSSKNLTKFRRHLIANGFWSAARAFYGCGSDIFDKTCRMIKLLEPNFRPTMWAPWYVKIMTGISGIRRAEAFLHWARPILRKLRAAKVYQVL
jgi:glycosyltransferase involved in cell wall biosynthesis